MRSKLPKVLQPLAGKPLLEHVIATAEYLKSEGVEFVREPGPMNAGTRIIAFFKDPNGYVFELNEPLS